ncbi:MAG TPA: hypothetical protein VK501_09210 [Baekduia sp.]|uniref:hypothetical protein n=1 Tax=Baekduia sp. TaxID=2600305 RepID=UPI002C75C0B7|nr:hypothetical protein [Baekduia sp.]HMJ34086.1 hypothetical protein [Baekduia sp.]
MPVIVKVRIRGSGPNVESKLRALRARLDQGRGVIAIWTSPRWQSGNAEMVDDVAEVEMLNEEKRVQALHAVREALQTVDPRGETIFGGDLDLEPLSL